MLFCLRNIKNYVNSLARTIKQFVRQNQSLDFISVETGLKVKIDWPAVAAGITVSAGVGGRDLIADTLLLKYGNPMLQL